MNSKELIGKLEKVGWFLVSQNGSHKKFKHTEYKYSIVVPCHSSKDLSKGLLHNILKQAGLK